MATKNYFISGLTELLILLFLDEQDYYVYDITRLIEDFSGGYLNISQNTIYTAAYKLENENKISEYSKLVGKKRTRIYYHIEAEGKVYLQELITNYQTTTIGTSNVLKRMGRWDYFGEK